MAGSGEILSRKYLCVSHLPLTCFVESVDGEKKWRSYHISPGLAKIPD